MRCSMRSLEMLLQLRRLLDIRARLYLPDSLASPYLSLARPPLRSASARSFLPLDLHSCLLAISILVGFQHVQKEKGPQLQLQHGFTRST